MGAVIAPPSIWLEPLGLRHSRYRLHRAYEDRSAQWHEDLSNPVDGADHHLLSGIFRLEEIAGLVNAGTLIASIAACTPACQNCRSYSMQKPFVAGVPLTIIGCAYAG